MIFKFDGRFIAALAVLFCATTAFAQENRGTPNSEQPVRPTHSGSAAATFPIHRGRVLPEAEQIRSQQCVSIGLRAKRRPSG